MNKKQIFSPKYWVTHNPETDDVYPCTMHKTKRRSETLFLENLAEGLYYEAFPNFDKSTEVDYFVLHDWISENFECSLVELNLR